MGGCNSCCRCNTESKRPSFAETVPSSEDNAHQNSKITLSEKSNSPPAKTQNVLGSVDIPEDKNVVVHETVSGSSKEVLHKENQNLSLLLPPAREFSGKPKNVDFGSGLCDRQIPVKRQGQGKSPSKSRPENVNVNVNVPSLRRGVPSRRLESPEPRIPVRKIPVKKQSSGESRLSVRRQNSGELEIPVKRVNSGDLRSSSPTVRAAKGSRRIVKEGSDSMRGTSSSRRVHLRKEGSAARVIEEIREVKAEDFEERNKGSVSSDSEKLVVEVAEKPRTVCEMSAKSAALSEDQGDSALPPIDLENPLISLDCFIFL